VKRRKLIAFIKLTRPLFLLSGVLLNVLGILVARSQGATIDLPSVLIGQALVTSIQLMTHYCNEYFDLETDRLSDSDRTWFSGGSGVLAHGDLSPAVARRAAIFCLISSTVLIVIAGAHSNWMWIIGATALIGAWFYSAPPVRLVGQGWGELATSIIVALLVPMTGYVMQTNQIDLILFEICAPLTLILVAAMIAVHVPDYSADSMTRKRTLVVRVGRNRAGGLYNASIALGFVLTALIMTQPGPWGAARFVWLAVPLAVWQIISAVWHIRRGWQHLPLFTFGSIALFFITAGLWVLGFIV
jgi:1,4-dihydroxy-2-naphthoate octaprenyltransferase